MYEHWAWFYMEHYILCASMYMCTTLHYARQAACPWGSHQFQFQLSFWVACQVTTRGPGAYCPQCAYSFFVCRIQVSQVCFTVIWPWAKIVYLHFIYSLCALHDYECNQIVFILSISSASSVCFVSIEISRFSFSYFFLPYYLLSFVAHLVLFTIPGSSMGVPVVGLVSSVCMWSRSR